MDQKISNHFYLWLGAAISIAEIITGTLIAPLGLAKGLLAIVLGHLIGCGLFLFPAAYIASKTHQTAIQSTGFTFGNGGIKLFSLLNGLQLLGWTAVMIVTAQQAMNTVSNSLFHFKSPWLMATIVALLIIVWLLLDSNWLFRINNSIVIALVIGMFVLSWLVLKTPTPAHSTRLSPINFGNAVELSVTMALSWLPLIGDYTKNSQQSVLDSAVSVTGYFIGSVIMFSLGLVSVIFTGQTDFTQILAHTNIGLIVLFIIVFSTVTTTFMDAFSAATNFAILLKSKRVKLIGVIVTLLGWVIALFVSLSAYQNFLYSIGAVFTPLFSIVFVSYFWLKGRLPIWLNFLWWIVGVILYNWLLKFELPLGQTFTLLIILTIAIRLTALFFPKSNNPV